MTYTLIMVFTVFNQAVVVNVPGFTSAERCRQAAKEVHERFDKSLGTQVHESSRICLGVR